MTLKHKNSRFDLEINKKKGLYTYPRGTGNTLKDIKPLTTGNS